MAIDFSKYDKMVDLEGLKSDVKEAIENGGEFKKVPYGEYEVSIDKIELGMTQKNVPKIVIFYKILDGEYKNSRIFQHQLVGSGQQIHIGTQLLNDITEGEIKIEFESYQRLSEDIEKIKEYIDKKGFEYAISYSQVKKDDGKTFDNYKILEVFEG